MTPAQPSAVDRAAYDAHVAATMTEDELLANVRDLATLLGWLSYHTHDSRRSEPGFPDLVLVHPTKRRLLFAELKRQKPRPTAAQKAWLDALREVAEHTYPRLIDNPRPDIAPVEVHLWRPSDWLDGTIEAALR